MVHKYPPRLKILSEKEREEIESKLNEQFGVKKIPGIIVQKGEEKLFLFQGSFDKNQINELEQTIPVERVGIYFAKIVAGENKIRLSIEGSQILKNQITKNIFELNESQLDDWMKGRELNIQTGKRDFLVMKYKDNFLGTGKASEEKISNFIPKNRRLKDKSI